MEGLKIGNAAKLNSQQVMEIRSSNLPAKQMTDLYGVALSTIYNVLRGHTYGKRKAK